MTVRKCTGDNIVRMASSHCRRHPIRIDSMAIRLIALDIDGTLLDSGWKLPEANREAVVEAVRRGIEVALVTGRRFDFAKPISAQLGCPITMVVNNGALVKSS